MMHQMGCAVSCINLWAVFFILLCSLSAQQSHARTITDSSPLDNLIIRPLFHKFRNFTFGIVGPTSLLKRSGKFYQSPLRRFPCDTSFGRSNESPDSVHKLRPGNVAATAPLIVVFFKRHSGLDNIMKCIGILLCFNSIMSCTDNTDPTKFNGHICSGLDGEVSMELSYPTSILPSVEC